MAASNAAMTVGTQVYGSDGSLAGQIDAIDDTLVTIKLANGSSVRVPRSGLAGSPKGAVVGVTTTQLNEVAGQPAATQASASPPAGAATETPGGGK